MTSGYQADFRTMSSQLSPEGRGLAAVVIADMGDHLDEVRWAVAAQILAEIPELMEAEVEKAGHRFVRAAFRTFSPSSIDFDFLFEVDSGDPVDAHAAQEQVAFGLLRTFRDRGIAFAYPTQTTFTAAPDGTLVMPYAQALPAARQRRD